jgi:hypothetical protein
MGGGGEGGKGGGGGEGEGEGGGRWNAETCSHTPSFAGIHGSVFICQHISCLFSAVALCQNRLIHMSRFLVFKYFYIRNNKRIILYLSLNFYVATVHT